MPQSQALFNLGQVYRETRNVLTLRPYDNDNNAAEYADASNLFCAISFLLLHLLFKCSFPIWLQAFSDNRMNIQLLPQGFSPLHELVNYGKTKFARFISRSLRIY